MKRVSNAVSRPRIPFAPNKKDLTGGLTPDKVHLRETRTRF